MLVSRVFILGMLSLFALQASAQTYNNPGGTVQTCTGNFYDTGGSGGTYNNNAQITTTFCSDVSGQCITVNFTSFNLEIGYDFLYVYDGPSTTSALIGTYSGTALPPSITARSGCLTFTFHSDGTIQRAGWEAQISCDSCPLPACTSPLPDECSIACQLGTLTPPPACPSTGSVTNVFYLSNIGATPAVPYRPLGGCQPSGANMPNPAADVWYSFIASSNILDVRVQGLNTPSVGFYEGNLCNTFIGRGCAVGSAGLATATFQPVYPGRRYYLRISGADTSDTGNFTVTITGRNDCDPCLINYNLVATPLPVSTVYQPGQRVHFCFRVSQWSPTAVNWIHAVVPHFGPGWDVSSITTNPPPSCDGYGSWKWYNSVTSTATGLVTGPGFFYESSQGCPSTCNVNNPGDNYGDNCTGIVNFIFCWDVVVDDCPPASHGDNLNVSINTYGDGESGSWSSFACAADPLVDFFATLSCCPPPGLRSKSVTCNGAADGWIVANANGVAPFTYNWLDTAGNVIGTNIRSTPDTLKNLAAGIYVIEITDALQCFTTNTFTLTEPPAFIVNLTVGNISCNGQSDGSISVAASGGITPYTYSIDSVNFQPSNLFAVLSANTYTVTVRDDSACATTQIATVLEPALLTIALDSTDGVACFAESNGAIYTTAAGGTLPYEYSIDAVNSQPSGSFPGLLQGNYSITVRDSNSCIATLAASVTEPILLTIALDSIIDAACFAGNNGAVYTTVSGGTTPYVFQWSNNDSTEDITGLTGDTVYILLVRDSNLCSATDTFPVLAGGGFTLSTITTDATCNGLADGAVQVIVTDGTLPFEYLWSNGDSLQTTDGVIAGIYSVIVTDGNNCTDTIDATVQEPALLSLQGISTSATCAVSNDGIIELTASGGISPYAYSIDGTNFQPSNIFPALLSGNYQAVTRDSNNCTASVVLTVQTGSPFFTSVRTTDASCFGGNDGTAAVSVAGYAAASFTCYWSTTETDTAIAGLTEGDYFVTVTDSNGCSVLDTAVISDPAALTLTQSVNSLLCNGGSDGSIALTVSGGTPAYSYLWNNGRTSATIDSLRAGTYDVVVTDSNHCTISNVYSITEPAPILLLTTTTDVTCAGGNNGTANVIASGGTAPFSYAWDNETKNQTTSSAVSLTAGDYSVIVTDLNQCRDTASVSIAEPPALLLQLDTVIEPLCNGDASGSIAVSANGGSGAYNFSWNPPYNGAHPTTLRAGEYNVTVTDANGCTDTLTATVAEPLPFTVYITPDNTTIQYGDSIQLSATHSPATIEPSYIWEPSGAISWCITPCSNPFVTPVTPTTFTLTLIDPNAPCTATAQAFVNVEFENVIYPPNAFTPDGDGINDEFEIFFGPTLVSMDYMIFNRWGEKIFQSTTLGDFWDGSYHGKQMNPGAYVYAIKATFLDGKSNFYKGSFTLLR